VNINVRVKGIYIAHLTLLFSYIVYIVCITFR